MSRLLLIDGDLLLYRFAFSNEYDFEWDTDTVSEADDFEKAKFDFEAFVEALISTMKDCGGGLLCFSSQPNFRYQVLPTYKHNRKDTPKPKLLYQLRDWAIAAFPSKVKPTLEADDILGVMMTKDPDQYIIASIDKDLKQVPGRHYDWKHDKKFVVTEAEADLYFYTQVLTGDPTDGYQGCPGIGKKRAAAILAETDDPWQAIVAAYEAKGLTEEDALQQARVARILRNTDYDFKKGEVKLWTPRKP